MPERIPNARRYSDDTPLWKRMGFWVAALAFSGSILNGIMLYKSAQSQQDFARIELHINYLSEELNSARIREDDNTKLILSQGLEIVKLSAQLQDKTTQEELLNGFIESLPFPAWLKEIDDNGIFRVVTINELFTVTFGLTKAQAVGSSDYNLFPKELADDYQKSDRIVSDTNSVYRADTLMVKHGKRVAVLYVKFPVYLPSGFKGVGGIIRDQ
jgi:PAS domain S-box-containing protein|tara:strand:+ start:262 stop:903 length:642 start_codon:yes stop_codon:yes gene_type:complete